ncbi:hypothetical protein J3362_01520 [Marinobacter sp. NFXS11]|uniref:hypothetical protein n=1 Tax=Marinobacter sp. NFXS11 TaxID=2818432 RepID=UPI0032DFA9A0
MTRRGASYTLWVAIALGIAPAVVTGHISPFSIFDERFGLEVESLMFLPPELCLVVFVVGIAACVVLRRFVLMPLLLPWLALVFFPPEKLTEQFPSAWDAQERLYENEKLARESAELPDLNSLRSRIGEIDHTDTGLFRFERAELLSELDQLSERSGAWDTNVSQRAAKIAVQITALRLKIGQANSHLSMIDKSLRDLAIVSRFSLGLANKVLGEKLRQGRNKVIRHRNALETTRRALRVELTSIQTARSDTEQALTQLRDLDARISTYLWASDAYRAWQISMTYKLLCLAVLVALLWVFPMGSTVYLSLLGVSLFAAVFYSEGALGYRLWLIVQFLMLCFALRIARLLVRENIPLLRRQSGSFLLQTCRKTLVFYLPFLTLLALGLAASWQVERWVDNQLYSLEFMADSDPKANRRQNIDSAISAYFDEQEKAAFGMLDSLDAQAKSSPKAVAAAIMAFYETEVPETLPDIEPEMAPPGCSGFLPWVFQTASCAETSVKEPLNEAYADRREAERERLDRTTQGYAELARTGAANLVDVAREDLSSTFHDTETAIKKQLGLIYAVVDIYAWVSWFVLILVVIKSLMYIFARVFFGAQANGERMIQFESEPEPRQSGRVRDVPDRLDLTPDMGELMYVSKRYDFANAPPDEVTPQAQKAFFSRFLRGAWHMNRIWTGARVVGAAPYRRLPADERIVVWTLKPGDAVIFSWKQFVGMSDSIGIRTRYSWQLASLVFGRMFYVVACVDPDASSDGTLLLSARGSDGTDGRESPSNSPDQLLAWQTTTRFEMHANLNFRNVYRSGVQIRAFGKDLAVTHSNVQRQRSGAARFLTCFLMPV